MSFIADVARLGILPLQHQDASWPRDTRLVLYAARITGREDDRGVYLIDTATYGQVHGGLVWTQSDKGRKVPLWSWALAGEMGDPATSQVLAEKGARKGLWLPDEGLDPIVATMPLGLALPAGYPGVVVAGSNIDAQEPLFVPGGGLLVAVHFGQRGVFGSLVFDTKPGGALDIARRARLHSLTRVYEIPDAAVVPLGKGHALAWQLGRDVDGNAGAGTVADDGAFGKPPPPRHGPAVYGEGFFKQMSRRMAQSATTTSNGGPEVLAAATVWAGGPFDVGDQADPHQLGTNSDGEAENSLHASTMTLFRIPGGGKDAPLEFLDEPYIPPGSAPFLVPVYLRYDAASLHPWVGGAKPGLWRWESESYFYIPEIHRTPHEPYECWPPPDEPHRTPDPKRPRRPVPDDPPPTDGPVIPPPPPPDVPPRTPTGPGGNPPDGPPPQWPAPSEPGASPDPPPIEDGPDPYDRHLTYAATTLATAFAELLLRPQRFAADAPDLRFDRHPDRRAVRRVDRDTPIVGRLAAWGEQASGGWPHTVPPCVGDFGGGTGAGGVVLLPPEVDLAGVLAGAPLPARRSPTTLALLTGGESSLAFGTPSARKGGGVVDGFRISAPSATSLVIERLDGRGAAVTPPVLAIDAVAGTVTAFGRALSAGAAPSPVQSPIRTGADARQLEAGTDAIPVAELYLGAGSFSRAPPALATWAGTDASGVADTAATSLAVRPGRSTGSAEGGSFSVEVASAGAPGAGANPATTRLKVAPSGVTILAADGRTTVLAAGASAALGFFGAPPVARQSVPALDLRIDAPASPRFDNPPATYDAQNEAAFRASAVAAIAALHAALKTYGLLS